MHNARYGLDFVRRTDQQAEAPGAAAVTLLDVPIERTGCGGSVAKLRSLDYTEEQDARGMAARMMSADPA